MTRNHSAMSISTSCLRVPVNPYNQQPSPSYERRQVVTPNTEDESSFPRKPRPTSASSRPASSLNSPVSKQGTKFRHMNKKSKPQCTNSSPLDSFLDFYESIPDYQDVTHLSSREFEEKLKLLRNKQRQYQQNLSGTYSPVDYEDCQRQSKNYEKKTRRGLNKIELAKEWVNKSCDSLSSLSRKSENEYRGRSLEIEGKLKKPPIGSESPRKHPLHDRKDETEGFVMDTGSSLSTCSNFLKTTTFALEEDQKPGISTNAPQDSGSPFASIGRTESCQGLSSFLSSKDSPSQTYDFYNLKESSPESQPPLLKKKNQPSSCGLQSSGTSELNVQDFHSPLPLMHHEMVNYEDYFVPTSGWMQSDSDSMLGAMHHIPSTRPSTAMISQSLPGSPVTKRTSSSSKICSPKKKTRRKRRGSQKSVTKPVPFSFMSNERQYSRSTPDLSSHCRSPSPKHFRARPIPRNLFSNYIYQKKREDEFFRALKRKVRAEGMLRAASLPPAMEFRERLNRVQAEAAAAEAASLATVSSSSEQSASASGGDAGAGAALEAGSGAEQRPSRSSKGGRGRRGRPRRPPDFTKCHEKMRQELYERQGRNVTTSPSPYSLRTANLSPRRKGSTSSCSDSRRCRPRSASGTGMDTSTSRSNLAALLRIQSARQRLEAEHHRLREEQMRRAEVRLKERLTRLTPAWRAIRYSTEEDLALRAAARRQEERERRLEHGQLMRHMLHRVHTIPTLFERQSTSLSRLSRSPHTSTSPRRPTRHALCVDQCGPKCPVLAGLDPLDDEDAADVKVFVPRADSQSSSRQKSTCRPSRSRHRDRPCSAQGPGSGRRSAYSASPDKHGRQRRSSPTFATSDSPVTALRSPDRLSSKLRNYHRQLPHAHRVEFSDSPERAGDDAQDDADRGDPGRDMNEVGEGSARGSGSH